jgi:uncharacterized ferritin-like protein (DUF455 family)
MRKFFPVDELARDRRFTPARAAERLADPRNKVVRLTRGPTRAAGPLRPERPDAPDAARQLMHSIFTGEIQALEGAGRTVWDFNDDAAPFALKLDMARQCWDEARHTEISVKLGEWMGTEVGEFAETRILYEVACHPDPIFRLAGVNRSIEGLAIDVFNTMREFGRLSGDPVLAFCEDWMLADEVTHVKMGSDWLRRLTESDPERRRRALEFQRSVDALFCGFRGEREEPIRLARSFRRQAGFGDEEIDEIAALSDQPKTGGTSAVRIQPPPRRRQV